VFAQYLGFFTPDVFFINALFVSLVMLLVGGMTSLAGAVVGTITISAVQEILRRVEAGINLGPIHIPGRSGLQELGLAIILVVIMIRRPLGITGGREIHWPFGDDLYRRGGGDEPASRGEAAATIGSPESTTHAGTPA
jgi:branched-chain amino acid transport system permease protein